MSYQSRDMVCIDSKKLVSKMNEAGYSIRKIAKEIKVDRKTIMKYLKLGKMPTYILVQITAAVKTCQQIKAYRFIWMRLGVKVPVTEDELLYIMDRAHQDHLDSYEKWAKPDGMEDYDLSETEARVFLRRAIVDGESYIPEMCFDEHKDWWMKKKEMK